MVVMEWVAMCLAWMGFHFGQRSLMLGAGMAAVGLMILVSSFLATGATRVEVMMIMIMMRIMIMTMMMMKVYRSHVGRVGGRVATAVFIFLTYVLLVAWLLVLFCCIIVTTFYTLSWGICHYKLYFLSVCLFVSLLHPQLGYVSL